MPIWTAIFAVAFLGEAMNRWKLTAIVLGLVGVIVIVRPQTGAVEAGQLWALAAALGFGISVVMVKSLTRNDGVVKIVFWMLAMQAVIGAVPAWLVWQPVPADIWIFLVAVSFCGAYSHYCMARAMLYADATVVVPMDFLRVPLMALVGWMIYSESVDAFTVAGAALILAGNLLNLRRAGTAQARAQ
jgi:drug/metabolite transporter (DMT)-like permease